MKCINCGNEAVETNKEKKDNYIKIVYDCFECKTFCEVKWTILDEREKEE